jgi:hypothetical protein
LTQAQVGDDDMVAFLHLHGSRPVGGEHGTEVEWRYSYQVIPLAAPLLIRPADRSGGASWRVVSPLPLSRFTAEYGEIEYGGLPVSDACRAVSLEEVPHGHAGSEC